MNPSYLHTDTLDDALSSLEVAVEFYDRAQHDDKYWKWFVVAMHSATQGTFTAAIGSQSSIVVQKPGIAQKMIAAFEARSIPPAPHMDNFLRLYKKMQAVENLRSQDVRPLPESTEHENGLKALDELRDEFLHFNSKSWSISKEVIVDAARTAIAVIRFVLLESRAVLIHERDTEVRVSISVQRLAQRLGVDASPL